MSVQSKSGNRTAISVAQEGYVIGQKGGIINSQISGPRPAPPAPSPSANINIAKTPTQQNLGNK